MPVYDGYRETVACLTSVLGTIDPSWVRLLVVNDCSPDVMITDYLRSLARETPEFVLIENSENLGFVASVNIGMAYDRQRDVALLNSDVEVAGSWLERLREAAYVSDRIASVTPFSNNATVCSFPNICEDNRLPFDLSLEQIDAQFAVEFTPADMIQIPTGVGCCMFLRRDCLDEIGYFDLEAFGRGYGEENDWCQRAAFAGWQNMHVANCYVYHCGGVSFGEEYSPRLARALDVLDRKYPRYHGDIQRFIADDPARVLRVRAWLRLFASQQKPKVLMISHKRGGGAQQHVDELAQTFGDRALFLLLMPDKDGKTVRLSFYDRNQRLKDGLFFTIGREYSKLVDLLRGLGIGRVHFHHTLGLPKRLWGLARDLGCEYDLTVHDYYLINGNATLTDKSGRFVPVEAEDFDLRCAEHRPLPPGVDAIEWRKSQSRFVQEASRVIFPSRDVCRRFTRFFEVRNPVVARHPGCTIAGAYPQPEWRHKGRRPLRVLVLGALNREKGADVLDDVAASLASDPIEFHLLGYAYRRLCSHVMFHGPYDNRDVHSIVAAIDPDVVWFPVRWPETYSYTLSIALRLGLPVVVPDIGAFAERVQGRPHSAVIDWDQSTARLREFWLEVIERGRLPTGGMIHDSNNMPLDTDFYEARYLQAVVTKPAQLDHALLRNLDRNLFAQSQKLSRSELLLKRIWHFSLRPFGSRLFSMVPFKVQRTIKRSLSQRPLHDLVGK